MSSLGRSFLEGTRYLQSKDMPTTTTLLADPTPIPLKRGFHHSSPPVFESMAARRSQREFNPAVPVTLEECSDILFAAQGITASFGSIELRAAPSAGARYPIDVYLAVRYVTGLKPGCYKLNVEHWALIPKTSQDPSRELYEACLNQDFVLDAALNIIMTAVPDRSISRYRDRGVRYVFMDAAHIAQNILLAAVALGLGACAVGAFFDDKVESVISADGKYEVSIYVIPIGRSR